MLGATAVLLTAMGALAAHGGTAPIYAVCVALLLLPPLLPLVAFNAVASCFDARQAKRLFPLVAAAATVGTIAAVAAARTARTGLGTTVLCVEDGQLLRIPRAELEALLDESPELARGVIRTLLGHLRSRG